MILIINYNPNNIYIMNVNITGVHDYTDLCDNIILLQTLNDGLPFKYANLTTFAILSNDYE
jgi:hypothetical protein